MGGYARRAVEKIVEAIMKEKRVGWVLLKALRNFFKVDRAVIAGVAGLARAAVAAEGFMVEETLPFTDFGGCGRRLDRYPRQGDERVNGCCEGAREGDGRDKDNNKRSVHGDSPRLSRM